ncbi:YbaB/EbfC family nucleoid-associated protein [Nonomuraea typhae]|uniref:YbaB/EbfC family nucleoid-associated protein n=1 Tax=Nonomuraea typhae TaxID=2603600 RepID=A0ABW7Z0M6_9ACTN
MTDAFRSVIEELTEQHNKQLAAIRETYDRLHDLESTVKSSDGMISIVVGANGQVRSIDFNPRVYQKLSPSELSDAITTLIAQATGDVAERTKELIGPLIPDDLPLEEVFGTDVSLDAFLPQPVEAVE